MDADQQQPTAQEQAQEPDRIKPDFTPEELLAHVPADVRSPSFAVSVRGYDRAGVDAYVKRVNRVIAELEVSRSPQAAVRHALDRVGQQTIAVLQEARESADKLMAAAREEAEEGRTRAKEEAAKLVVNASADADRTREEAEQLLAETRQKASEIVAAARAEAAQTLKETEEEIAARQAAAEARLREIEADTQAVLNDRHQLLENVQGMAGQLQELARSAAARVADEPPAPAAEGSADGSEMPTLSEGRPAGS